MQIRVRHLIVGLLSLAIIVGCTTSPQENRGPSLSQILDKEEIVSIPYRLFGKGVFMVELTVNEAENLHFLIDTGATQSALYRSSLSRLALTPESDASVSVHGMLQSGSRPLVILPSLFVGDRKVENVRMAVLENRQNSDVGGINPAGLIGMDLLSQYRIYVDADTRRFNLIPKTLPPPKIPWDWHSVELTSNPFVEDKHDLHFMRIRLGNHQLPALLDTGSEENLMNWSVSKYPQLKYARKKLYERWLLEGAIGTFEPQHSVRTKNLRSGGKYWKDANFIVMEFDGLEILGVRDQPFLIAGSPLLAQETFYIDFAENIIKFKPPHEERRGRTLTSTKAVFQDKDRAQ